MRRKQGAFIRAESGICAPALALFVAALNLALICSAAAETISVRAGEILDAESLTHFSGALAPDSLVEWEVFRPDPERYEAAPGLLVFVSPIDSGALPGRWQELIASRNLVWMGANDSGNKIDPERRIAFALLARVYAGKKLGIDTDRVYLTGFSGGGRVSSVLAPAYPHIFQGAIYLGGVNYWGSATPAQIDLVRGNRFVFVTGTKDFNRRETRQVFKRYRKAGIEQIKLLDIPGMGHVLPSAEHMGDAIDFLDDKNQESVSK